MEMSDLSSHTASARAVRRNVMLLAACQALYMTSTSTVVAVTAVAGGSLAPTHALATLPFSLQFLVTTATIMPASLLMQRIGRRAGFLIGLAAGVAGAALAAWGLVVHSFALFSVGSATIGILNGCAVFYRFAAADAADEAFKSRAISLVMAGGVVAAFTGPNLAQLSQHWIAGAPFAGSFAALIAVHILAALLLSGIDIPPERRAMLSGPSRPLHEIVQSSVFLVALAAAAAAYAGMNLVMTATPPAMLSHGHEFTSAAFVIQWHIFGMFAPAFVTGHLIARFSAPHVIAAGAALILICAGVNLAGQDVANFTAALLALGIGWNFMFVGATSLLAKSHTPAEKAKVQGFNDLVIFSGVAAASLASGAIENLLGWAAINLAIVIPVGAAGLAALWLGRAPQPGLAR
jgi:MFS family permease